MKEYVDREELSKLFNELMKKYPGEFLQEFCAANALKHIPAADVKPVVRGAWEDADLSTYDEQTRLPACSRCHCISWNRSAFCPNCGADMRPDEIRERRLQALKDPWPEAKKMTIQGFTFIPKEAEDVNPD